MGRKNHITIYEFDALYASTSNFSGREGMHAIPEDVFNWCEKRCPEIVDDRHPAWLRLGQRGGHRVVQVTNFVGVIRASSGFQIEVLPKIGKAVVDGDTDARQLLIEMLQCLQNFRHIETARARLAAARMPLLEVFIAEFLQTVDQVVKRGLRSSYASYDDNLSELRGKLLVSQNLRLNLCRADRFFTRHDLFSSDRPENRLLHTALRHVLAMSNSQANLQLARQLSFVFADIPQSDVIDLDFQRVHLDRNMRYYADALAWARLLLYEDLPLTGKGEHMAPSLLFPMEAVFEAYVARCLARQLVNPLFLKIQPTNQCLVRHLEKSWFQLNPDLIVANRERNLLVLDTKWKLLNSDQSTPTDKYGLSQSDFYQLSAYGQNYLDGEGDVALIYPKTDNFSEPLPPFDFIKAKGLRLWVLPFCLKTKTLFIPQGASFWDFFRSSPALDTSD